MTFSEFKRKMAIGFAELNITQPWWVGSAVTECTGLRFKSVSCPLKLEPLMPVKVMVVDDDPGILQAVEILLSVKGYPVVKAQGGQACLERLRTGFKGVILMDVMMPEMDGWRTIEAIVEENRVEGNVICMLTAATDAPQRGEKLNAYVFDFLGKPFSGKTLYEMVENAAGYVQQ